MATLRVQASKIESYLPSEEAKLRPGQMFVLDGRNFMFDSKGPGSFFGDRKLTPLPISRPRSVQGLSMQDRTFVFTQDAIMTWRNVGPFDWELLAQFDSEVPLSSWSPWSGFYFAEKFWFFQENRGCYNSAPIEGSQSLWLNRQTSVSIPGLPEGVLGTAVVRNRAIMVTKTHIYWSNTGVLDDLTPGPAGAGFIRITEFVQGSFLALSGFGDGFIVWTTAGGILAEFLGDENVWRWTALESRERPASIWSTIDLSSGDSAYMSRHGIVLARDGAIPEGWTPDMNEYFLRYMTDDMWTKSHWRVDYDQNNELLYIQESTDKQTFFRTLVLAPTRNKWGIFSARHYGMLQLTDDKFGFVDIDGYARYLDMNLFSRETEPDNADGLNLYVPQFEKQMAIPSSTLVSNATDYDLTIPMEPFAPVRAMWAYSGTSVEESPTLKGMDSWVEIGYLRPQELASAATDALEIQEVVVSSNPIAATEGVTPEFATAYDPEKFYAEELDLNTDPVVTTENIEEDWDVMPDSIEDWGMGPPEASEDWSFMLIYESTWDPETDWDLMAGPEVDVDLMGIAIQFPELSYQVKVLGSIDGITFAAFQPDMAKFSHGAQVFTGLSHGMYHRLRIEASELGEYYHARAIEYTAHYSGSEL